MYESGANVQRTIPLSLDMMDELISKQAAQLRDNETQHENAQRHLRQANAAQQHACQEVEFLQQRNEDMAQKVWAVFALAHMSNRISWEAEWC